MGCLEKGIWMEKKVFFEWVFYVFLDGEFLGLFLGLGGFGFVFFFN